MGTWGRNVASFCSSLEPSCCGLSGFGFWFWFFFFSFVLFFNKAVFGILGRKHDLSVRNMVTSV